MIPGSPDFPEGKPLPGTSPSKLEIADTLRSYLREAQDARRGGDNPRDDKWSQNLALYWNRYDFSDKAPWQARVTMPEVPAFVDRFAASMKEALMAGGGDFFTIEDFGDPEGDLKEPIKRITKEFLATSGRSQNGFPLDFEAVFEEQVKLGTLMAMSAVVLWKDDIPGGRVAIEAQDPQSVWLDHTYRDLYRVRRYEVDRHSLYAMAKEKDSRGQPIWNLPELHELAASFVLEEQRKRQDLTGGGDPNGASPRVPITIDEFRAVLLNADGTPMGDGEHQLVVMANEQYVIRGPEANPFWHGQDWLVFSPLVTAPLSVYGRSYMEDFGTLAENFTHITNLIIDAVRTSSMNAFAVVPGVLENPADLNDGIGPNKMFKLQEGYSPRDFAEALVLGTLPPSAFQFWEANKSELREAAGMNEIGLGQFAPNSRTSATEISSTQESSSALVRSVAKSIETRWVNPVLDRVWKTGIQHVGRNDPRMIRAAGGPELWSALYSRRKELIKRPMSFAAYGISALIKKAQKLNALLRVLQVIASNELLLKEFLGVADMHKLVLYIFDLADIDLSKFQLTERERMMQELMGRLGALEQSVAGAGQAPPAGRAAAQSAAEAMGVQRG